MSEEPTPREKFSGLKFSQMKGCDIQDAAGTKIGNLQDALFKRTEHGFELTKFLVGGSLWEELLEDIGVKDDIDPVFPISALEGVSKKGMRLNVDKDQLKSTTVDEDAIETGEFKLSQLGKYKLTDINDDKIGNIIDVTFSRDAFQFIIGDGFIKELAEDLGLLADVDLLLEVSFIENFDMDEGIIKLNKNKLALKETFEKHIPKLTKETDLRYDEYRKAMYFPRSQF